MKRWDYANCRALLTCARNVAGGAAMTLRDGMPQLVECAQKATEYGKTLYDRLSWSSVACFVAKTGFQAGVGAGVGLGVGILAAGGGATADDNDKLARCSNNSQANAFVEAVVNAAGAGDENASRIDINLGNGHTLVLYGKVYPADKVPGSDLCPKP